MTPATVLRHRPHRADSPDRNATSDRGLLEGRALTVSLHLREEGWISYVGGFRTVVALRADSRPRLIQITMGGDPLSRFTSDQEQRHIEHAAQAGAIAELVWWPPANSEPEWIDRVRWRQ